MKPERNFVNAGSVLVYNQGGAVACGATGMCTRGIGIRKRCGNFSGRAPGFEKCFHGHVVAGPASLPFSV